MAKKISVDDLSEEIAEYMANFVGATEEAVEQGVLETADDVVRALRSAHPSGAGDWHRYDSGWAIRKKVNKRLGGIQAICYNEKFYRLTHLLEYGHAIVSGGRKVGEAGAFPHIKPIEERAEKDLIANIKHWITTGWR